MQPFIALFRAIAIGEAGPVLVADEEQVSEHIHALALLSVAEKRAHRQFQVLSKQVKQRAFNGRSRVNCHPLVKCLQTSSLGIAISKLTQYTLDDPVMVGDVGVQDEFPALLEYLADALSSRHLAGAGVPRIVAEQENIANEKWRV